MKILNLYAGIGGNRKYWEGDVTAVENDKLTANFYKEFYPGDTIVIGDAVGYLESHYNEFDFIWASPPCTSHSQMRYNAGVLSGRFKALIPDMTLYSLIVFLDTHFKGLYVVENVAPYYKPLIPPTVKLQRHLFWANFNIPEKDFPKSAIAHKNSILSWGSVGEAIVHSGIPDKIKALRNQTNPDVGKYILDCALVAQRIEQ